MNLEKGKIIELEDNIEYYIIDKIELHEKIYLSIIKRLFLIVGKKGCE